MTASTNTRDERDNMKQIHRGNKTASPKSKNKVQWKHWSHENNGASLMLCAWEYLKEDSWWSVNPKTVFQSQPCRVAFYSYSQSVRAFLCSFNRQHVVICAHSRSSFSFFPTHFHQPLSHKSLLFQTALICFCCVSWNELLPIKVISLLVFISLHESLQKW